MLTEATLANLYLCWMIKIQYNPAMELRIKTPLSQINCFNCGSLKFIHIYSNSGTYCGVLCDILSDWNGSVSSKLLSRAWINSWESILRYKALHSINMLRAVMLHSGLFGNVIFKGYMAKYSSCKGKLWKCCSSHQTKCSSCYNLLICYH